MNAAPSRWLTGGDETFLTGFVHGVPGLLDDYAAARTLDVLAHQEREGVRGALLEIGVFYGRYLSLLVRSALRTGDAVAALDTFENVAPSVVRGLLEPLDPNASTRYVQMPSRAMTAEALRDVLGGEARFVSIDGSHALDDALHDLQLAEAVLGPRGVVAVDDFLCPVTPGVNEAVHRFFATPRSVVPFAYTANKLFLCAASAYAEYRARFERSVVEDERDQRSANFRACLPDLRILVEQPLWGTPVLIVP